MWIEDHGLVVCHRQECLLPSPNLKNSGTSLGADPPKADYLFMLQ